MTAIPITTLRLLDIKLPEERYAKVNFIGAAKDLIRKHSARADAPDIDPEIFHNKSITYSAIQLDRYMGVPEWSAYGDEAVEALWYWLELFREENPELLHNSLMVQEHYTPAFLPHLKKYRISPLLVSDSVSKELNAIMDKFARNDRMEKYLFGNLLVFFKHIGFENSKEQHFLKISVEDCYRLPRALPVYHGYKKSAYRVAFSCNFLLPQTLRLGQSTAIGYGKVIHLSH
ncbi:MAG TPA: hypothetical protein ENJ20_00785 [Bacteroidetes bacterium]|nr:hypothetical protein [Bacteroidota bacterium]